MYTQNKENLKKPGGYSRGNNDHFRWQAKLAVETSPSLNNPINSIKGISACFECQKNNIRYDEIKDEVYCFDCGLVLRQGLTDYTPSLGSFPSTDKSNQRREILEKVREG